MFPKTKPFRSDKLRKSARGAPCMLRGPTCNGNPETSVLCHSNSQRHGKGMGQKAHDFHAAIGCSDCHLWLDHGWSRQWTRSRVDEWFSAGRDRTLEYWFAEGVVKVA